MLLITLAVQPKNNFNFAKTIFWLHFVFAGTTLQERSAHCISMATKFTSKECWINKKIWEFTSSGQYEYLPSYILQTSNRTIRKGFRFRTCWHPCLFYLQTRAIRNVRAEYSVEPVKRISASVVGSAEVVGYISVSNFCRVVAWHPYE